MNPGDMNQLHATRGDYPTPRKAIVTLAIIAASVAGLIALQPYVMAFSKWFEGKL